MKVLISRYYIHVPSPVSIQKIRSYSELTEGWYHGGETPPSQDTIESALCIAKYAQSSLLALDSAPGLEGEIQLAVYGRQTLERSYLEITLEPDGCINITQYDKRNDHWEIIKDRDVFSIEEVKSAISDFRRALICPDLSGYFQSHITLVASAASEAARSRTSKVQYQLYGNRAFQTPEPAYATI